MIHIFKIVWVFAFWVASVNSLRKYFFGEFAFSTKSRLGKHIVVWCCQKFKVNYNFKFNQQNWTKFWDSLVVFHQGYTLKCLLSSIYYSFPEHLRTPVGWKFRNSKLSPTNHKTADQSKWKCCDFIGWKKCTPRGLAVKSWSLFKNLVSDKSGF